MLFLQKCLYPKKMRELIEQFRKDKVLNEKAIAFIEGQIRLHTIVGIIIVMFFLFLGHQMFALLITFVVPVGVKLEVHRCFKRKILPYSVGIKRQVRFIKAGEAAMGTQGIIYEDLETAKRAWITIGGPPKMKKEDLPSAGEIMTVYQDAEKKFQAMPDVKYLRDVYSLKR